MVVDYDEEETGSVENELVVDGEGEYGAVNDELEVVAPSSLELEQEELMKLEDVLQLSLMVMRCLSKLLALLLLLLLLLMMNLLTMMD